MGGSTVYRTKRRFVLGDLPAALSEQPRPGAKRKLSGKEEALLVATACSNPPAGRARWTLELLAASPHRAGGRQAQALQTHRTTMPLTVHHSPNIALFVALLHRTTSPITAQWSASMRARSS